MGILILNLSLMAFVVGLCLIYNPEVGKWPFRFGIGLLILSFVLPFLTCLSIGGGWAIGLSISGLILLILTVIIITTGMFYVPNDPIHIAVITRYKKIDWKELETSVSKEHGWRFVFLKGIIFDYILLDVTKINKDRDDEEIITPDNAKNYMPISYTFTPGAKSVLKDGNLSENINYYHYIKSGKKEGVINIIDDKIGEKAREFGSTKVKTWQDLRSSGDETTLMIIEMVAGEDVKNFSDTVKAEMLKKVRHGNGTQPIETVGITLNRLNIGRIKLSEELEKAIGRKTIENAEREAEKIEQAWIKECVMGYLYETDKNGDLILGSDGKPIKRDVDIKMNEVIELVQSERNKIKKEVKVERKEYKLDSDTGNIVTKLAVAVIEALRNKDGGAK